FTVLSFERSKERTKEKSPAGDKLPEIQINGGRNSNNNCGDNFICGSLPGIPAYRLCSEFLYRQFITGGLFLRMIMIAKSCLV
ncbi:MAG: hypothetical protein ABI462_13895, partial [Ignavibacteria bacterium]